MLTPEQVQFYEENGFLILEKYATYQETDALRQRMNEILDEVQIDHHSVFSTNIQTRTSDQYFLESGDKIRCFFEEQTQENGEKKQQINKVGHALHELDEVYKKFSYKTKLLEIAQALGHQKSAIIQSQYIFKPPQIGGNVSPHMDSTFLYTEPLSCFGIWIALEDATIENACLWALPQSHKIYPLQERFVRNENNDGTLFVDLVKERSKWNLKTLVPLEVKKGDAVLLHGSNVHLSYANTSKRSRNAYVLHLIDMACEYPKDNWLQRGEKLPLKSMMEVMG